MKILSNETIEVLEFKTIDALDKELELLTKDAEEEQTYFSYND